MRAFDIALFLILLNSSFWLFDVLGIWAGPAGQLVGEGDVVAQSGFPSIAGVSVLSLFGILAGIIVGGMAGLASRITTPQVVGIVAFAAIFGWAMGSTVGIMSDLYIPVEFITLFTTVNFFILVAAVIQLATGASMRVME